MNDYITLDGKKYATVGKNWQPQTDKPMTITPMADGTKRVTFGTQVATFYAGEIIARVVEDREGWGSSSDLETSLNKTQIVTFTDHMGIEKSAVTSGWKRRSLTNMWSGAANKFYYEVRIILL